MSAIDPSEHQPHPAENDLQTTKHPAWCLVGFVVFVTGAALTVHLLFQALF